MKILVCVKPVKAELVTLNERIEDPLTLNPYDNFALQDIIRVKKELHDSSDPCEITCMAMGIATFVSQNLGSEKYARANQGARFSIIVSMVSAELIGLAMYFFGGENHVPALCVIAAGMALKVVEFILRLV